MPNPALGEYTQHLSKRLAAHLLRRTTYNFNIDSIKHFTTKTPGEAVEELFDFSTQTIPLPTGPIDWNYGAMPPVFDLTDTSNFRLVTNNIGRSAILWRTFSALYDKSARWKLMHWLHTLFTVRISNEVFYHYWKLLETCMTSDLKTIAIKVTNDSNMMLYLNNYENIKGAPNENFAREVLELMTIRKGPATSLGNYTNYTEADIQNAAKVLTGYTLDDTTYIAPADSVFNEALYTPIVSGKPEPAKHDFGEKVFSAELTGNQPIVIDAVTDPTEQTEEQMYTELKAFYTIVYNNPETAKSFVRRMYRFFVRDTIDAQTETTVIEPLAADLMSTGYDHIYVLKKLLKSNHFYDMDDTDNLNEIVGGKIKSPWELVFQSINQFNIPELPSTTQTDNRFLFNGYFKVVTEEHFRYIGLNLRGPDTVEGYTGFYEEPKYSKNWFSSSNLYRRYTIGESLKGNYIYTDSNPIFNYQFPFIVDLLEFFKQFEEIDESSGQPDPGTMDSPLGVANANQLVTDMITYFLPQDLCPDRSDYFLNALLGGLSPVNWYFSWLSYLSLDSNATDFQVSEITNNVTVGLERLFDAIISSPEFQTF